MKRWVNCSLCLPGSVKIVGERRDEGTLSIHPTVSEPFLKRKMSSSPCLSDKVIWLEAHKIWNWAHLPSCQVTSVMSDSVRPHRWQPTRLPRPWDSPGKNNGVGYHFLLQCMKVKSESEVAQLCPTLSDPIDGSPPGSSVHGIFQARVLEWGAIAFSSKSY